MSLSIDQLTRGARRPAGAVAVAVILFLGLGAPASASAVEPDFERSCDRYASDGVRVAECVEQLRIARDATAKYRDPAVALRDGFVPGECVDAVSEGEDPALGAMGEHWIRIDRMADEEPSMGLWRRTCSAVLAILSNPWPGRDSSPMKIGPNESLRLRQVGGARSPDGIS